MIFPQQHGQNAGGYSKQEGTTIEKVEYTENFREITFSADKEAAESNLTDAIAVMSAGITVCVFQAYLAEEEIKTTIYMKDETTGEVYDTTVYPDVFGSSNGES